MKAAKDKMEDILLWSHLDEMWQKNRVAYNLGWYQDSIVLQSKTSGNWILHSEINPRTEVVKHRWFKRKLGPREK